MDLGTGLPVGIRSAQLMICMIGQVELAVCVGVNVAKTLVCISLSCLSCILPIMFHVAGILKNRHSPRELC